MVKILLVSLVALSFCLTLNGAPSRGNIKERDFIHKSIIKRERAAASEQKAPEHVMDPRDNLGMDMILKNTRSVGIQNSANQKWTNGIVPYVYQSSFNSNEKATIKSAMDLITSKTGGCIQFKARTNENDYISIIKDDGCYSYVGRIGGSQPVSLSNGCVYLGTITHEFMHALGFHHEQNRADRDTYVDIKFENIEKGLQNQFDKIVSNYDYHGTNYDYQSIMQYSEYSFSKNNQKTIVPINSNGNPSGLDLIPSYDKTYEQVMTSQDISAVRTLYSCSGTIVNPINPPVTVAPPVNTVVPPVNEGYEYTFKNNLRYTVYVYYRSTTENGYGDFYESLRSNSQETLTIRNEDHYEFWIRYNNRWLELGEIEAGDAQNDNYMTASELYDYFNL